MSGEVEEAAQPSESAPQHRQQDQRQRVVCDRRKTRVGISSKAKGSSQQSSAQQQQQHRRQPGTTATSVDASFRLAGSILLRRALTKSKHRTSTGSEDGGGATTGSSGRGWDHTPIEEKSWCTAANMGTRTLACAWPPCRMLS
ncbi:unnamed protein product [Pylaiella littoralis]